MGVKSATAFGLTSGLEPAMVFLTTQTFSGVTSVSLPNNTFTDTYDNYLLFMTVNANSADTQIRMKMRASGTDFSGSDYNFAYARARSTAQSIDTGGSSNTSFYLGEVESAFNGRAAYKMDIISPKLLDRTRYFGIAVDSDTASNYAAGTVGGVLNNALAYDSVTVIADTDNSLDGMSRNKKVF